MSNCFATAAGLSLKPFYMPADIINEVRLFKCGTNQVKVYVDDYKAFFMILGTCRGAGDNFFALNKADWEVLKKFIDSQLTDNGILDITPIDNEIEAWQKW